MTDEGMWKIGPRDSHARVSRHYQPGTLILITRFETEDGALRLVDFTDAHAQLQLDVYGEVIDAFHHARLGGLGPKHSAWDLEAALLEHLEAIWREPDESIWEVRGGRQQFIYSKVMCWVGFDRAVKTATAFGVPGPVDRWRALAATIHDDVCRHGSNPGKNSFVQTYGNSQLDASLLLLPALGFLPPEDDRVRGTVAAIERELVVDGLVMRYDTGSGKDGLPAGEGALLPCSFWLVDAYALAGRFDDACELFERLLALRNDVGLLSGERRLTEWSLSWLEGYEGSRPVRIGSDQRDA